jgi:hypothetical protein
VDRFEHRRKFAFGIEICRRRNANGTDYGGPQVGEDIAEEIRADDDVEPVRTPDGAEENGIEFLELPQGIRWHHSAGGPVGLTTPVKVLPRNVEGEFLCGCFDDADSLRDNFLADSVSGNYGD